jgi:hypothetical protein
MTAFVLIRTPEAVVVASDGIFYDENGIVCGTGSKAIIVPEWSCVIVMQGQGGFLQSVRCRLGQDCTSFDDMLRKIVQVSEDERKFCIERGYIRDFNMALAGWSESRERFETYALHSVDSELPAGSVPGSQSIEPWKLTAVPAIYGAPGADQKQRDRFGLNVDGSVNGFEYAQRGIWAARYSRFPFQLGKTLPEGHCVGGFLEVSILRRDRIETSIVHRWPDPVGEMIDPTRGEPIPEFLQHQAT